MLSRLGCFGSRAGGSLPPAFPPRGVSQPQWRVPCSARIAGRSVSARTRAPAVCPRRARSGRKASASQSIGSGNRWSADGACRNRARSRSTERLLRYRWTWLDGYRTKRSFVRSLACTHERVGTTGEGAVILADEEHDDGARLTLGRGGRSSFATAYWSVQASSTGSPSPGWCGPKARNSKPSCPASKARAVAGPTRIESSGPTSTSSPSSLTWPLPLRTT